MLSNFRFFIFLSLFFFLLSCFHKVSTPDIISLNDDIKLFKGPKNKDGCTQYFPQSKSGKPTIQVVYFLDRNSNPTTESNPKNCR